jgi:hypothetical protein
MTSRAARQRQEMLADLRRDVWAGVTLPPRGYFAPSVPDMEAPMNARIIAPRPQETRMNVKGMPIQDLPPTPRVVEKVTPIVEVAAVVVSDDRLEALRKKYPDYIRQYAPQAPNDRRHTSDGVIWWSNMDVKLSCSAGAFCLRVVGKPHFGDTPRDAYRAWWRARRLSKYNVADLLKEMHLHIIGKENWCRRWLDAETRFNECQQAVNKLRTQAQIDAVYATNAATDYQREIEKLRAQIADLEVAVTAKQDQINHLKDQQPAPAPAVGERELDSTRRYLAAYLTLETPEDPAALLEEVSKPWHERGRLWIHVVNTVKNAGITVGSLPMELSKK